MDIACPSCAAAYKLDEATVGPKGRKVRCAACGEVWRVMPAESVPADPASTDLALIKTETQSDWPSDTETVEGAVTKAAPPEGEAATEPPAETAVPEPEAAPPKGAKLVKDPNVKTGKASAWRGLLSWRVATVAGTLLALTAGLLEREAVVRLLPQTARLYAAAGFPVNLRGIEIRNVKSRLVVDGDEPVLVIDGDLVNVADRKVDVPRLHFALTGTDGRQVYVWSAQADRANLQPGETLNFRRRLAAPPAEAKNVSVRFVTRSDITAGIR
jgi:predicted Zn finger-like uncharacterized protein